MMDTTYYVKDGMLYKSVENDGGAFLRRGPEEHTTCLGSVKDAETNYPDELKRAMRSQNALRQQA
jgi:hypothetical protein